MLQWVLEKQLDKIYLLQTRVKDVVKSPTFSIVNEYISKINGTVYHFDFFRILNKQEALDVGLFTYFDSQHTVLLNGHLKLVNYYQMILFTFTLI